MKSLTKNYIERPRNARRLRGRPDFFAVMREFKGKDEKDFGAILSYNITTGNYMVSGQHDSPAMYSCPTIKDALNIMERVNLFNESGKDAAIAFIESGESNYTIDSLVEIIK